MTKRPRCTLVGLACGLVALGVTAGTARAQDVETAPAEPATPPEGQPPPAPSPPPAPAADPGPAIVVAPPAPAMAYAGPTTDHDAIIGAWGIEARRIATLQRTLGQEAGCETSCPVSVNSLGVRHWVSQKYAWNAGIALAVGGGAARRADGTSARWDTFFGAGPSIGASFLLANWQHLAVSLSPQLDFLFFKPSGRGSRTVLVNFRALVEGEIHLGMIDLPAASVGIGSGLVVNYLHASRDKKAASVMGDTSEKWSVGFTGPTSLWDLVTQAFVRYYF